MSFFETLLALIVFSVVALSTFSKKVDVRIPRTLALLGLLLMLVHFLVDIPRWEMLPFYIVGVISPFVILISVNRTIKQFAAGIVIILLTAGTLLSTVSSVSQFSRFHKEHNMAKWVYMDPIGGKVSFFENAEHIKPTNENLVHSVTNESIAPQPVLIFSNSQQITKQEYKELIVELVESGYSVMSVGPEESNYGSKVTSFLVEKQIDNAQTIVNNSLEISRAINYAFMSYNP